MRRESGRILDEFLVAAAQAGDRKAFNQLAGRWQSRLYAHAYRLLGDREAARDTVQEAWNDIIKNLAGLKDTAVFPAWAYRIVTRRSADRIRRIQRQRKLQADYASEAKVTAQAHEPGDHSGGSKMLTEAMAALPPDQRATIALFYGQDLSVAETAAALSVPAGTVKTRLMHARRKLRAALEGENHDEI